MVAYVDARMAGWLAGCMVYMLIHVPCVLGMLTIPELSSSFGKFQNVWRFSDNYGIGQTIPE